MAVSSTAMTGWADGSLAMMVGIGLDSAKCVAQKLLQPNSLSYTKWHRLRLLAAPAFEK